jgi:hypothetical protein
MTKNNIQNIYLEYGLQKNYFTEDVLPFVITLGMQDIKHHQSKGKEAFFTLNHKHILCIHKCYHDWNANCECS